MPFLTAKALASNIGGTATLVGDEPDRGQPGRVELQRREFSKYGDAIVAVVTLAIATPYLLPRH